MVVGLGPIGSGVARLLAARKGFRLVAGVDRDRAKTGQDLGAVVALGRSTRIRVVEDAAEAVRRTKPEVAVLCTGSSLRDVTPQIEGLLERGVPVVSTAEELAYPWFAHRRLAQRIDAAARKAKVAVAATGINPGFAMDALPITLTSICERVDGVRVDRLQDAARRRLPFQQKIGSGLSVDEFAERVKARTVRHVGLTESVAMIAGALGWTLDRVTDEVRPKIAERPVESPQLSVDAGRVCGIVQEGIGYRGGRPSIVLHMEAYLGAPETFDQITIEGFPRLCVRADGGFPGDVTTAAIVVNTIPRVLEAAPGLHTMRSLALPAFFGGR